MVLPLYCTLCSTDARVGGVAVLQRNSRFIYYLVS